MLITKAFGDSFHSGLEGCIGLLPALIIGVDGRHVREPNESENVPQVRIQNLSQTAKSPIRLNPDHPSTVFRVGLDDLKPGTTYYYTVSSIEANGTDDGTKSAVK